MTAFTASFCFFFLVYGVAAGFYAGRFFGGRTIEQRFVELVDEVRTGRRPFETDAHRVSGRLAKWISDKLPKPRLESARAQKLSRNLIRAGILKPEAFYEVQFITVGLTIAGAICGYLAAASLDLDAPNPFLFSALGAAAGFLTPTYYLRRKARSRQQAIATELADALDLLVVAVEAGLGLSEAIKVVGEETERQRQDIGREFSLVSSAMSAGATMGEALRALVQRTSVEDLRPLVATLIQSEQLGSRIGPALRASSDALRERRRLRAEEAAHKMTIKMIFPLGLLVLPAMIMVSAGPAIIQLLRILVH